MPGDHVPTLWDPYFGYNKPLSSNYTSNYTYSKNVHSVSEYYHSFLTN